MKALIFCGLCATATPVMADPFEDFGTAMKYGLPAVAAVCAARDDRLEDFALRGALQVTFVYALKYITDGQPISLRPTGGGKGFPSGHASAAAFGAADLAGKCFEDKPAAGAATYGLAGLTAASRVYAGEHTATQAITGSLIGFSFGAASFGIGSEKVEFSIGMKF